MAGTIQAFHNLQLTPSQELQRDEPNGASTASLQAQPRPGSIRVSSLLSSPSSREPETFEELGEVRSSLSRYSQRHLHVPASPSFQSREAPLKTPPSEGDYDDCRLEEGDEGESEGESEDESKEDAEDAEGRLRLAQQPVASWVSTLNHFATGQTETKELLASGSVFAELPVDMLEVVPIMRQVDMSLYTFAEQRKRWRISQCDAFRSKCLELWELVSTDGRLGKDPYIELISRFHVVCCPPPLDQAQVMESSEKDWQRDSDNGVEIGYDRFFQAVFQCVDIWTESTEEPEYIALFERLIGGCTLRGANGLLTMKPLRTVKFDTFFTVESPEDSDELRWTAAAEATILPKEEMKLHAKSSIKAFVKEDPLPVRRKSQSSTTTLGTSKSAPSLTRRKSLVSKHDHKKHRKNAGKNLTPGQVNVGIVRIYQAYIQTDIAFERCKQRAIQRRRAALEGPPTEDEILAMTKPPEPLRFDRFVVRYFERSHGTVGIAKRHLRMFVASVEALLAAEDEKYPRARLFCELAGLGDRFTHNARLMPHVVKPILRALYPDLSVLLASSEDEAEKNERDGARVVTMATLLSAFESALPESLNNPSMREVLANAIESARTHPGKKAAEGKILMDPDKAIWLAFPTFRVADALRGFARFRCANAAVRLARRYLSEYRRRHLEAQVKEAMAKGTAAVSSDAAKKSSAAAKKSRAIDLKKYATTPTRRRSSSSSTDSTTHKDKKKERSTPRRNIENAKLTDSALNDLIKPQASQNDIQDTSTRDAPQDSDDTIQQAAQDAVEQLDAGSS